ncbi:hypothetical protein Q8A67_014260 [Cirrhinus molitorella]|uniref:Uncharacterized protein n=1 Tax=Cirrhinus molitorella TaxID=172907 RepID=A0AA88PG96_9TELE|nr:hypothetical protein Q8A67_014260 [Cirrhinus molitorella]
MSLASLCSRSKGSRRLATSELKPAQPLRASPSPPKEASPILFSYSDQRLSVAASDLRSCRARPMTPPLPSAEPSTASTGMDAKFFHVLSKAVEEMGLEWSPSEEPPCSRLNE